MQAIEAEIINTLYLAPEQFVEEKEDLKWNWLHWLNTPGPVFVSQSDNCGTGQPAAPNNVIGDSNYYEAVFRQPKTVEEFEAITLAADLDPFQGYAYTGVLYWNLHDIRRWWSFIDDIAKQIRKLLAREISFGPGDPHLSTWNIGGEIKQYHLFGPPSAIPENYKNWLDYFESGEMQSDIEDFAHFLETRRCVRDTALPSYLDNIAQQQLDQRMIKEARLFVAED